MISSAARLACCSVQSFEDPLEIVSGIEGFHFPNCFVDAVVNLRRHLPQIELYETQEKPAVIGGQ